jgi:uncharacterized protein YacL
VDRSSQSVNVLYMVIGLVCGLGFSGLALRHENISVWGVPEPVFFPTIIMVLMCVLLFVHGVVGFVRERRRIKLLTFGPSNEDAEKRPDSWLTR